MEMVFRHQVILVVKSLQNTQVAMHSRHTGELGFRFPLEWRYGHYSYSEL